MKAGQCIHILAILVVTGVFVQPGMAAENGTADAATNFYNIGVNLLETKEYARAIVAFDQALASDTTMIRQSDALLYTYQNKAYALIQLDRYTAAIQTIDEGLAIYGHDEKLWYNKGYASFKLGNYQDALNAYDTVLQVNNASLPALNNRGDTLFEMGRYQDAVDAYARANAVEPNDPYSLAGLAKAQRAAATATLPITTTLPPKTGAPLSLMTIVAALSIMGLLSTILMRKG